MAQSKIDSIEWGVPHYTPSMELEKTKQILSKTATELPYAERSLF